MQKNLFLLTALLFLFSLPLAGGGGKKKIISLSPAITEIIFALGGGDHLAGRSSACNYPLPAKKLPVMGDFGNPKREKIVKSGAKYILTNDLINPTIVKRYKNMGISFKILPLSHEKDYFFLLTFLGKLLGKEKEAALLAASFQKSLTLLEENRKKYASFPRKKALFIVWDKPLLIAGKGALPGRILALVGLENIASSVKSEYFKGSMEWILKEDPDYILFPGVPESRKKSFRNAPYWKELKAVKKGSLITDLEEDLLFRLGPRWGKGVLDLQKRIFFPEKRGRTSKRP